MDVVKALLKSKKFVGMLSGIVVTLVAKIGWDVPAETINAIVGLIVSFVVGQGLADFGKEKAKVEQGKD